MIRKYTIIIRKCKHKTIRFDTFIFDYDTKGDIIFSLYSP